MTKTGPLNRTAAKSNPAAHFGTPVDLANSILLTGGEKITSLKLWRSNILQEMSAASEGMKTNRTSARHARMLEEIEKALNSLSQHQVFLPAASASLQE